VELPEIPSVRAYAEFYASRGWRVIPCHAPTFDTTGEMAPCTCGRDCGKNIGKHPRPKSWPKLATSDPASVKKFNWKNSNIGIATGQGSNLLVLDVDPKNGGADSLLSLEEQYGPLPQTWRVATPSGGQHFYFTFPSGLEIGNSAGRLGAGLDIRGDGGQVVAAPSFGANAAQYTILVSADPAPPPGWLLDLLLHPATEPPPPPRPAMPAVASSSETTPYGKKALESEAQRVATATDGTRNETVNRAAFAIGRLVGGGEIDESDAKIALLDACAANGLLADDEKGTTDTIYRALAAGAEKPKSAPTRPERRRHLRAVEPGEEAPAPAAPADTVEMSDELDWRDIASGVAPRCPAVREAFRLSPTTNRPGAGAHNIRVALSLDPRVARHIWRDRVSKEIYWRGTELLDEHVSALAGWFETAYFLKVASGAVQEALLVYASQHERDPLCEWLGSLRWDGVRRAETWLASATGCEDTPLTRTYALRFLVGCVARAFNPGVKLDTALVLVGRQGLRKSTLLRTLVGDEWFSDTEVDLNSKDAYVSFQRPWVQEFAELASLNRTLIDRIKSIMSSQVDRFRPPYARNIARLPRRCCFVGTTNAERFLNDPTGARRFWPVRVNECRVEWMRDAREQLWAEAVVAFRDGCVWHLDPSEEGDRDSDLDTFRDHDPWTEQLQKWVATRLMAFTISEALDALDIPTRDRTTAVARRVASALRVLGYSEERKRVDGKQLRLWAKEQ
jgi:predicted P-loop ATPase